MQWILDSENKVTLWGAWKPEYLETVNNAIGWRIDKKTKSEINQILEETIKDPIGLEILAPPSR